jgi:hypothetical protein
MITRQETYRKHRLSKSDYLAGTQCPKQLWLRANEPTAVELQPGDDHEALFEQGRRVGELARTRVPAGTLIDFPYYAADERLRATKLALEAGCDVIYEAAFAFDKQFVAIDILERVSDGFIVTEVKSSTKVKPEHLEEVALQAFVLEQNGLRISKLQVMHINRECTYAELANLFSTEDVTAKVTPLVQQARERISAQAEVIGGSLPVVNIGPHCSAPYECPFKTRCWAGVPSHHVTTLYRVQQKKAFELVERGFCTIPELPNDFSLSQIAERQRRAVVENNLIVEATLKNALSELPESIGFLDFETVGPAIPVWPGCRPYDAVPVQFSFCKVEPNGELTQFEWLADGAEDPRERIALALIDACRGVEKIAAYNASFELRCLQHLANAVPHLAVELEEISSRVTDLLPIVREHVYHPEFYGGFGLKEVLPAITGEDTYGQLPVADGTAASWLLQRLLFEPDRFSPETRFRLREDLLDYCRTDTIGLFKLLKRLEGMAADSVVEHALDPLCVH